MTTLTTCDFEIYCEIENLCIEVLADDDRDLEEVEIFALAHGVEITDDEMQNLIWELDEEC